MLNTLTALSLCEIALGQITTAAASKVDQKSEGKKKVHVAEGSFYTAPDPRELREIGINFI